MSLIGSIFNTSLFLTIVNPSFEGLDDFISWPNDRCFRSKVYFLVLFASIVCRTLWCKIQVDYYRSVNQSDYKLHGIPTKSRTLSMGLDRLRLRIRCFYPGSLSGVRTRFETHQVFRDQLVFHQMELWTLVPLFLSNWLKDYPFVWLSVIESGDYHMSSTAIMFIKGSRVDTTNNCHS